MTLEPHFFFVPLPIAIEHTRFFVPLPIESQNEVDCA
jgi:hypothetical protein